MSAGQVTPGRLDRLALSRASIDRAGQLRADEAWLADRWADPRSRVLVLSERRARVAGQPPRLVLVPPEQAPDGLRLFLGVGPVNPPHRDLAPATSAQPDQPPDLHQRGEVGERSEVGGVGGVGEVTAYFAVVSDTSRQPDLGAPEESGWSDLRTVGDVLDDRDAGLLVHAVALANWHDTHQHCPRCGAVTDPALGGAVRRCPDDGTEHYPRTDPAVIMTVVDASDRLLLGRQRVWPAGRFSTLAGFVEPGESLEQAVRREVGEEVGLAVDEVTYLGSQPWPFPSSLMLGFTARTPGGPPRPDGEEIVEARWYTRPELARAVEHGALRLPPPVSIARRLIEYWYGGPLRSDDRW